MSYIIIKTKPYERSVTRFLDCQQPKLILAREKFKQTFSSDPFDPNINTHSVYGSTDQQHIIFTSYIGYKVRLIRLMIKPETIIPYMIMEDHDYYKLKKLYPAILSLIRYI